MKKRILSPISRQFLVFILFMALIGGVVYFNQDLSFQRSLWKKNIKSLFYLPSNTMLKRMSLGHSTFVADLVWIRTLLYAGSHFIERSDITWIPRYTDAVVTLDPKFKAVYRWGSTILLYNRIGYTRASLQKSIDLLHRAKKEFPHEYIFPHDLGMIYLHELKLGRRSYSELQADYKEFCLRTEEDARQMRKKNKNLYKALELPVWKLWEMRRRMRSKPSKKWLKLFRKVKRCVRKRASQHLVEAASKENAPAHIGRLAALLLKYQSRSKIVICEHIQDMLWRTDNDGVREKLTKQVRRFCDRKVLKTLFCQEQHFSRRWKRQKPYIARQLFTLLDLPTHLEEGRLLTPSSQKQDAGCLSKVR